MEGKTEAIEQLRKAIERTIGKTLETNKDFESLSNSIYEKTHVSISTTTLKRIWGYLSESVTPRRYTLDQLARFLDYDDFDAFCASLETDKDPRPQEDGTTEEAPSKTPLSTGEGAGLSPSLRGRLWLGHSPSLWGGLEWGFLPPLPCCFSCYARRPTVLPTTTVS